MRPSSPARTARPVAKPQAGSPSLAVSRTGARGEPGFLHLTVTAPTGRDHAAYLRRHLLAAHAILHPPLAELSLALVGDRRMSVLHEQFLGVRGPTDVLTFPLETDRRGRVIAGEVVVCISEARRRCRRGGTGLRRELLLYALHGMLHLCGFEDRTDWGFATMHRTEDHILTLLGVGPVFGPAAHDDPATRRRPRTPRTARTGAD